MVTQHTLFQFVLGCLEHRPLIDISHMMLNPVTNLHELSKELKCNMLLSVIAAENHPHLK